MNFKKLLVAYLIAGMPLYCTAEVNENLKARYKAAQIFVEQNYSKIAQITAGSLSLVGGSCVTLHGISTIFKMPKDFDQRDIGACIALASAISAIYCGYTTINNALDNKLNKAIKKILNKTKHPRIETQ